MEYEEFLATKQMRAKTTGLVDISGEDVNPILYEYERDIVVWAVRKGRAAIFAGTGLGKTMMYIEWARLIGQTTLIVAPLSVAYQTIREAAGLGVVIEYRQNDADIEQGQIYITNYERVDAFDPTMFGAVVLDESSILKNMNGKTRNRLIAMFADTPYRLCATATPAPNDISEIGNHAEFLGIMPMRDMTNTFFVHDAFGKKTQRAGEWRLKGHAHDDFFRWMASWAIALNFPSDLGYSDEGFILPELHIEHITVPYDYTPPGMLPGFGGNAISATDAKRIRRATVESRAQLIADMVNDSDEQWLIWCGLNDESDLLATLIPDSINIQGSMSPEAKAEGILAFQDQKVRVLITKIKIAGMGMNLQQSHNMIFNGLDYSWEGYYQAIRRQWRHKQEHEVFVYVVTSTHESKIFEIVMQKEREATQMTQQLISATKRYSEEELRQQYQQEWRYATEQRTGADWQMLLGDSTERMKEIPDNSVSLTITSPPFGTEIFVYSASPRDLSNSASQEEFWEHYRFIISENLRIQKPGTICCVHIMDGRMLKQDHGYVARKDFSGDCIEAYLDAGWVFVSRVTIWKNPQQQAIRLKTTTLQFSQMRKDSRKLRPALPDYLLIFQKPGDYDAPVTSYDRGEINEDQWIQWASPVWFDIKESNVLNVRVARGDADEKHMCPLQLDFIERCVKLWSNPGELVFDPFGGIGSTGYEALRWGRRFLGIELKPEYFEVACRNLATAETLNGQSLFDWAAQQSEDE
jgi:DNA modification methylase